MMLDAMGCHPLPLPSAGAANARRVRRCCRMHPGMAPALRALCSWRQMPRECPAGRATSCNAGAGASLDPALRCGRAQAGRRGTGTEFCGAAMTAWAEAPKIQTEAWHDRRTAPQDQATCVLCPSPWVLETSSCAAPPAARRHTTHLALWGWESRFWGRLRRPCQRLLSALRSTCRWTHVLRTLGPRSKGYQSGLGRARATMM